MTKTKLQRPWQNTEDQPTIGPLEVPWEIRKWVFVGGIGLFRTAAMNYIVDKKGPKVVVGSPPFRDANIADGKPPKYKNGTPVLSYKDMEAIFDLAENEDISLKEAFVKLHERKIDPDTLDRIKAEIEREKIQPEPEAAAAPDPLAKYAKKK